MADASSILPFSSIEINDVELGDDEMIAGSGELRVDQVRKRNVLADGTIEKSVLAATFEFSLQAAGDQTALNTDAPDQDEITILTLDLYGVVTVEYDPETDVSSISGRGKIIASPEPLLTAAGVDGTTGGDLIT